MSFFRITFCSIVGLVVLFGLGYSAVAAPLFETDLTISKESIPPGMPLFAVIDISCIGQGEGEPEISPQISLSSNDFHVSLVNSKGEDIGHRPAEAWYPAGHGFLVFKDLEVGMNVKKTLIIHQWCSTWLLPGTYELRIKVEKFNYRDKPLSIAPKGQSKVWKVDREWLFPLVISEYDDDAVRAEFSRLLEEAVVGPDAPKTSGRALLASDAIAYAQGPIAVRYQLEVLDNLMEKSDSVYLDGVQLLDMIRYLAHSNSVETAIELVSFCERKLDSEATGEEGNAKKVVFEYLVWAIHELHDNGTNEVKAITQPFVKKVPRTSLPDQGYFMNYSGAMKDY